MSGVATAIAASAVLGAGASVYGANQQGDAAQDSADSYNAMMQQALENDKEVQQWTKDMYQYGDIDTWQTESGEAAAVTPYKSSERGGEMGYYVHKDGTTWDADKYNERSRSGAKTLEKYGKLTWVPVQNTADKSNSQQQIEKRNLEYTTKLQPKQFEYAEKMTDAAIGLVDPQTDAAKANLQYTIDTKPEQALADIASAKYTQEAMPVKMGLVNDMSALARRNTEAEGARMAGAEVSQAYNTKQKTLGDNIRRTGALAGSGRMAGLQEDLDLSRVKDTAGARVAARRNARNDQFANIRGAIGTI